MVPLNKEIEYGVYGDLITIYPKPYSIYSRGTISVAEAMIYGSTPEVVGDTW